MGRRALEPVGEVVIRLEQALRQGASIKDACKYAGISHSTFHKWKNLAQHEDAPDEYLAFLDRITRARSRAQVGLLAMIEKAAKGGDWRAAAWKLERIWPHLFGRVDRAEAKPEETDEVPTMVTAEQIAEMSIEDLDDLMAEAMGWTQ